MRPTVLPWDGVDILLIRVRTEETRLINRAFMLASSRPPKPASAEFVQPTTIICISTALRIDFAMENIVHGVG